MTTTGIKNSAPSLLAMMKASFPDQLIELRDYFIEAGILLPPETLDDLPVRWLPQDQRQIDALLGAVLLFQMGGVAEQPYPRNWAAEEDPRPPKRNRKAVQEDLLAGPEPQTCGGLCVLNNWKKR